MAKVDFDKPQEDCPKGCNGLTYLHDNAETKTCLVCNNQWNRVDDFQTVIPTRPIIVHEHTPGPWMKDPESINYLVNEKGSVIGLFNKEIDRDYCQLVPELIQIAEMYFDYLQSKGELKSLPFMLVSQTLNKLPKKT